MGAALKLSGKRFGLLTAIRKTGERCLNGGNLWECRCDCGKTAFVHARQLKRGNTKSCGCLRGNWKQHGLARNQLNRTPTYSSWLCAKTRCFNRNNESYARYGRRGITMCARWKNSFKNFLADMGERPPNTTLDRIDPDGNYEPGNCRWAVAETQQWNKRIPPRFVRRITLDIVRDWGRAA